MLDQIGNAALQPDRRAWPMAVTRRVGARGGGYSSAVLAGVAMMGAPMIAGEAAASCARFLHRARAARLEGRAIADLVADALARKERVMGFGRPVVGPDERVPVMADIARRYGRADLPYVSLLREVEAAFVAQKGLRTTAAAWAAAILLDCGMTADGVHAVSNYWVTVAVFAQALYSHERGLCDRSQSNT
jgi:citrate synthase